MPKKTMANATETRKSQAISVRLSTQPKTCICSQPYEAIVLTAAVPQNGTLVVIKEQKGEGGKTASDRMRRGFPQCPKEAVSIRDRAAVQAPVSHSYCPSVNGTTESRNCRKRIEPAKTDDSRICARVRGRLMRLPALIRTMGFFGSSASTETTAAVPTAALPSPEW